MNNVSKVNEEINNKIYEIRGVQVMLDFDLALLYECTNGTKDINKAVKRNIGRFPEDFYFQLTDEELKKLWFQNGTTNNMSRVNPHAFTEQGVAMLASVLKTEIAVEMSVKIIRSFVYMRKYMLDYSKSNMLINHENRLLKLEESFNMFSSNKITTIYEGMMYDAYSILLTILKEAEEEIIIIDNYADKELLDTLKKIEKNIHLISKNIDNTLKNKYCKQYSNVNFICDNTFHDRYIIIDRKKVYISGMSLKDLGKKYSYICNMTEERYVNDLLNEVNEIIGKNDI